MALGNLGNLNEYLRISSCSENKEESKLNADTKLTNGTPRPDSAALYAQAIRSSRTHYEDRHVYPYTFQGGYYHRHKMYKEAFNAWASAGDVIRQSVLLLLIRFIYSQVYHYKLWLYNQRCNKTE